MNGFSQNNVTPYLIRGAVIPILSILSIDVKTPPPRRPHDHPPNRVRVRPQPMLTRARIVL